MIDPVTIAAFVFAILLGITALAFMLLPFWIVAQYIRKCFFGS